MLHLDLQTFQVIAFYRYCLVFLWAFEAHHPGFYWDWVAFDPALAGRPGVFDPGGSEGGGLD